MERKGGRVEGEWVREVDFGGMGLGGEWDWDWDWDWSGSGIGVGVEGGGSRSGGNNGCVGCSNKGVRLVDV